MLTFLPVVLLLAASGAAPGQATPAPQSKPVRTADANDKMICKRFLETGSLVRGTRVCKTKWEWDRARDEARASVTTSNGCKSLDGAGGC